MDLLYILVFAAGLIMYGVFMRNSCIPLIALINYSKENNLEVFGKKYSHYYFAMSNIFFVMKLLASNETSSNSELNTKIVAARKSYRLMAIVTTLLVLSLFILSTTNAT